MKPAFFLITCFVALAACPSTAHADGTPSVYEKALYDKAREKIISKLSDDDFAAYCATMNLGGETLLRLHDQVLEKQFELAKLQSEGFSNENPQVTAVNAEIKDLRDQIAVKISEVRKGLEIESEIADELLSNQPPYEK